MLEAEPRCRRCGGIVPRDAERFTHVLPLRKEDDEAAIVLVMCGPCGSGFRTVNDRDEYARLVFFG